MTASRGRALRRWTGRSDSATGGGRRFRSRTSRRRTAGSCRAATSATRGSTRSACTPSTFRRRRLRRQPGDGGPDWHLESVVYQVFPDRFAVVRARGRRRRSGRSRGSGTSFRSGAGRRRRSSGSAETCAGSSSSSTTCPRSAPTCCTSHPCSRPAARIATTRRRSTPSIRCSGATRLRRRSSRPRTRAGIRVVGDLTTNHVGAGHAWFVAARAEREPERGFFFFDDAYEHGYACWKGVPSLPKLDYESEELRERMYGGEGLGRATLAPAALRPRRMADRRREHDGSSRRRPIASRMWRAASGPRRSTTRGDAVVVAEHAHDARADLRPAPGTAR